MADVRARGSALSAAPFLFAALAGCTEEAIVAVDPDVPGATIPTVEATLSASELLGWRDTTFLGYELPATAGFKVLADRADLQSRVLGRFPVPDSIGEEEVETWVEAEFRLIIDIQESEFVLPYRLEVFSLGQSYDSLEATWTEARDGVEWEVPGGNLGELLGSGVFDAVSDSATADTVVVVVSAPVDSLLKSWQATEGNPGVAAVVTASGSGLAVTSFDLVGRGTPVDGADTLQRTTFSRGPTFIYDPPQPSPGQNLRLAGLPSARWYLEFTMPGIVGGVPLEGATINHAELRFRPQAPPDMPFLLDRTVVTSALEVAADAFAVGPKVPVGPPIPDPLTNQAQFIPITPEELALGKPLRINVTALVRLATEVPAIDLVRVVVRPSPTDAQAFGFWEFGSVEAPLALQPELYVLLTPPPGFGIP